MVCVCERERERESSKWGRNNLVEILSMVSRPFHSNFRGLAHSSWINNLFGGAFLLICERERNFVKKNNLFGDSSNPRKWTDCKTIRFRTLLIWERARTSWWRPALQLPAVRPEVPAPATRARQTPWATSNTTTFRWATYPNLTLSYPALFNLTLPNLTFQVSKLT